MKLHNLIENNDEDLFNNRVHSSNASALQQLTDKIEAAKKSIEHMNTERNKLHPSDWDTWGKLKIKNDEISRLIIHLQKQIEAINRKSPVDKTVLDL